MNWYQRLKLAQGYVGEYWIEEDGNLVYADGDIGDMNHEGLVQERARSSIVPDQFSQDGNVMWDEFLASVGEELLQLARSGGRYQKLIERVTGQPVQTLTAQDMISYGFVETELVEIRHVNKELFNIAAGREDARFYAIKNWGWKRVAGYSIETYTLTDKDLQIIVSGLGEIVPDDEEGKTKWNIECYSPAKYHMNIPLSVLESGVQGIEQWESSGQQNLVSPQSSISNSKAFWDNDLANWQNRTSD